MATLTELVQDVRTPIPEIPGFVAERQLLRAMRTFCQETRAWRVNIELSVTTTIATIDLSGLLPTNTDLIDIISMKNTGGGVPPEKRTFAWLDKNISDWRSETDLNARYYLLDGNNTIRLVPTPSITTAYLYDLRVAVKPTLSATVVNDLVISRYREELVHGALGHLYLTPRKPWTDLNLASFHQTQFMSSWPSARAEAADEFQIGVPRKVKYGGL